MRAIRCDWTAHASVAPAQEPLTLDEAKQHISSTQDDDNALVEAYLRAAREAGEQYLGRGFFTQTRVLKLSDFADAIWLPYAAPLQSVTSVTYYDTDGVQQTLATSYYTVETSSEPGRIVRAPDQSWPSVQGDRDLPVAITYVCGWSDVNAIPELVKQGMRLFLAAMDADRTGGGSESVPARQAAESLWAMVGPVYWREPEPCRA